MASGGVAAQVDVIGETVGWEWLRVVAAIVALVAGWYLGHLLVRIFGRQVARRFERPSVVRTVLRGIRTGALVAGALVAMAALGLRIGNIVLSVTVFSAVLGIVLAPIVGSVINGLFVLADQPYEIGDMIELVDRNRMGFVEDITLRYTKVFTLDNTFMVIPNSSIRNRDIINYSAEDERTRFRLELLVTYEGDLDLARGIMERAAGEVEEVIDGGPDIRIGSARYPARPVCYIEEYADDGVLLTLRYWVKQPYRLLSVRSKVNTRVWEEVSDADDVTIAYPHRHLVFDETSGEAAVRARRTDDRPGAVDRGQSDGGSGSRNPTGRGP